MSAPAAVRMETAFDLEDKQARELLRNLHMPRPAIYWTDLLLSSGLGWTALVLAIRFPLFSPAMVLSTAVAVFALYRGLLFVHEVSHLKRHLLPGFEAGWNALVGFGLLVPSFFYVGVHQNHHSLGTYGTDQDPEYLPFGRSSRMTVMFALHSFLIPAFLLVRFLLLTPIGLAVPSFQKWLAIHASSLTMNLRYCRAVTPELLRKIRRDSTTMLALWLIVIGMTITGTLPWRALATWLCVMSLVSFVNTLRTLAAHRYEAGGEPLDRRGQLEDSVDIPGGFWTELWAPVGLRYHALHHYFPGVPYHNLGKAHNRLLKALASSARYRKVSSPGLWHSLRDLYRRGMRPNGANHVRSEAIGSSIRDC